MITIEQADRLKQLPPYLFAELDRKKAEARSRGVDVIDLGVGDPDLPTPDNIIAKLAEALTILLINWPKLPGSPVITGIQATPA